MSVTWHDAATAAEAIGFLPIVWCCWLRWTRQRRGRVWWLVAIALLISGVIDVAARWYNPDLLGNLYPLSQASLIGFALLSAADAMLLMRWLLLLSLVAVVGFDAARGHDLLIATAASAAVTGLAFWRLPPSWLRISLLFTFGAGGVAWWYYCQAPDAPSWVLYQGARLLGAICFCIGASRNG